MNSQGGNLEIDRIATRTLGDAFERLAEVGRKGRDQCGPLYGPSNALTYPDALALVTEAGAALDYARDHLQYLHEPEPEPEVRDQFVQGDAVLVDIGKPDQPLEPATVIKMERYHDGTEAVLVRFDKAGPDGAERAAFDVADVKAVAQ